MSVGGFQTALIPTPSSDPESRMLLKSPATEQPQTALQSLDADYNSNSFNFSYDGSFSPHQSGVDMKEVDIPPPSPKYFKGISEAKSDKMISGFDARMERLSPLSVIAVSSAYQDTPHVPSSILSRTHVLRFHPGSDTMLSALNYNDSEMMPEGGFDATHTFSTLDGLLGGAIPDLLDGDLNQEAYGQDIQLSPQAFSNDTFGSPLTGLTDNPQVKADLKTETTTTLIVQKLKVKGGATTIKATSPHRPGTQPCPTCGKVFSNSSALTKHKLTHSDERKYVCQLCAKAFKRQDHLNGHMLTHRNKKPFECDAEGCGKSYCDARSLRRHKENHHSTLPTSTTSPAAFNTLQQQQTSFPASVITSSFTETSNRIQYAPPPTSAMSRSECVSNSTVIPASHLQFLTFQSKTPKGASSTLSSWQPQTINTGALLLAQNFGAASPVITAAAHFEPAAEQGNSSGSELSQPQVKQEVADDHPLPEAAPCFEVVNSSTGMKQLVALTTGSMNLQFESNAVVRLQEQQQAGESAFSRTTAPVQILKIEASDQSNTSSVPPSTPTAKEVSSSPHQLEAAPLLQQLLNQQHCEVSSSGVTSDPSLLSTLNKSSVLMSSWSQVAFPTNNSTSISRFSSQEPKPVECSLCQRKFKNIPALNGHMRLHGGYFKKESDAKKEKKNNPPNHQPLQTASTNVRALIEEKINQKRNFVPTVLQAPVPTFHFQPVAQQSFMPISSPMESSASQSSSDLTTSSTCDILRDLKEHFRVPHPPLEKHRRHSDSDHFILPKRPCTTFTHSALSDLLRNRVFAKRTCRAGSDPGEPLNIDMALSDFSDVALEDNDLHDQTAITPGDAALPVLSAEDIPEAQPMMDLHCLDDDRSSIFENSSALPEISVSELEMMQFTTPTEMKPLGEKVGGEDSNDDDVFLSPIPTSPMKHKKKRRPEPIYIPPYVNTSTFHSRLRSPRRFDQKNFDLKNLSPPPYTPPPMLSPVRSGSGLFWHIISGSGSLTPKSAAPITPSFGLNRKASIGECLSEEEFDEVPESDSVPHVNIGSNYQAKVPPFNPHFKDALLVKHRADKVWDPTTMDSLSEEEVEMYLELSCCALVPGGGRNKEYALHLLQVCRGDVKDAIVNLMDSQPTLPPNHPLMSFQYSENDRWTPDEIEAYHQGLLKCDKDFFSIAKEIPGKSVKQCIQFYYLWKKVCPDEYRRIRLIRRRKEQEIYNLRSKEEEQEGKPLQEVSSDKAPTVNGSSKPPSELNTYNGSSSAYEPLEEFPCKICGKVFNKVKSRSAHMKSHRQTDNDKKKCES